MSKQYQRKSKEEKEKEIDKLILRANMGIEECLNTEEQFKELLDYISKFYKYSLRNSFLIQEQFKGALAVGSFSFWKEKGFTVNKGEKGIKILVPKKLSDYFINLKGEEITINKATTEEKKLIKEGKIKVKAGKILFSQGYVFDISQTNATIDDLPTIFPNRWLEGEVKNYDLMYKAMENISIKIGAKIIEPKSELGAVKGVSYPLTKEVALNPRNTQLQNVKTLIHELAHAKLHTVETKGNYNVNQREFQAEMTAYSVCKYFGVDTSEYSFGYMKSWIDDVELKDKEKLIGEVRDVVKEYIEVIENTLIDESQKIKLLENKKQFDNIINYNIENKNEEIDFEEYSNNKSVEVIYSEVDSFIQGDKLSYDEAKDMYRVAVNESGKSERVLELRFVVDNEFEYADEFIINKGNSSDLTEALTQNVQETLYVKNMIYKYIEQNESNEYINDDVTLSKEDLYYKNCKKSKELSESEREL